MSGDARRTPGIPTYRRHSAEVTADRLAADVERWHDQFTPEERDAVAAVRRRLLDIAEEADRG